MASAGTARPRSSVSDRRVQMLRATIEVMGEKGYAETRISDVAERAGVSTGLVIYYFATKDDLLIEALRHSEDEIARVTTEQLASRGTAVEKLELFVEIMCVRDGTPEYECAWGLWFDLWAQAFRVPAVAAHRAELDHRWFDLIASVARQGAASGEFAEVDAEEFALRWATMLDGLSIQVALEDERVDEDRARDAAMSVAAQWLGFDWPARRRRLHPTGAASSSTATGARVSGGRRRQASGATKAPTVSPTR